MYNTICFSWISFLLAVENGFVKLVDNKDNGINHSESQESVARINGTVEYGQVIICKELYNIHEHNIIHCFIVHSVLQTSDEITLDDLPEKLSGLEQVSANS